MTVSTASSVWYSCVAQCGSGGRSVRSEWLHAKAAAAVLLLLLVLVLLVLVVEGVSS
jgi:hypothetical protein